MDNQNQPFGGQPVPQMQPQPQPQPIQPAQGFQTNEPQPVFGTGMAMNPGQSVSSEQPIMMPEQMASPAQLVVPGRPMNLGQPMIPGQPGQQPEEKSQPPLFFVIGLVIAGLTAATFIALFIWMTARYNTIKGREDIAIDNAVTEAVNNKVTELENDFSEREKSPYRRFAGPADFGELTFEFPKTWSVYEETDSSNGEDYQAYLNPDKVKPISKKEVSAALRVSIVTTGYDKYVRNFDNNVKNGKMSVSVRPINGENASVYRGELPSSKLQGIVAVFKIRDKVCAIQTDAEVFEADFNRILDTLTFTR